MGCPIHLWRLLMAEVEEAVEAGYCFEVLFVGVGADSVEMTAVVGTVGEGAFVSVWWLLRIQSPWTVGVGG